jgi:hypothetical protein
MKSMGKLEAGAMAAGAAAGLVLALPMVLIRYKVEQAELAVVVVAEDLTSLARRLQEVAILLVAAAAVVVAPVIAGILRVDLIQEVSVEELAEMEPIASDQAREAEVVAVEAVLEELSLWIAV